MEKYRIKEVKRIRYNGESFSVFIPQYLIRLFWVIPLWVTMLDDDYEDLEYRNYIPANDYIKKYISDKEYKIENKKIIYHKIK